VTDPQPPERPSGRSGGISAGHRICHADQIYGVDPQREKRYSPPVCLGVRGAPEPHDADVDTLVHAPDERVLKEDREPLGSLWGTPPGLAAEAAGASEQR